jgi:hypothetical protein
VASITVYSGAPLLVALATFAAYTVAGHRLDVAAALTALALFEILRFPLFMLPQIINRIVEAGISLERVREFLLCEEYRKVGEGELTETGEVMMRNGTFVYGELCPIRTPQSKRMSISIFVFNLNLPTHCVPRQIPKSLVWKRTPRSRAAGREESGP